MELQEAIEHTREVAEGCAAGNKECAYQHDQLANWLEELKSVKGILGDDYDLDRLRELVEADREGRCGIPPVKLHQHIYRVFGGKILEEIVCKAMWELFTPKPRWKVWVMGNGLPYYWADCIGKTVFLTREDAEAALKGEQNE